MYIVIQLQIKNKYIIEYKVIKEDMESFHEKYFLAFLEQ